MHQVLVVQSVICQSVSQLFTTTEGHQYNRSVPTWQNGSPIVVKDLAFTSSLPTSIATFVPHLFDGVPCSIMRHTGRDTHLMGCRIHQYRQSQSSYALASDTSKLPPSNRPHITAGQAHPYLPVSIALQVDQTAWYQRIQEVTWDPIKCLLWAGLHG